MHEESEPIYVISVVSRMLKVHPQTLRYYERLGLVQPSRLQGRNRLYSARDIERLQVIQRLVGDLGVNLAGVEVILNLTERIASLEHELDNLRRQIQKAREHRREVT